MNAKGTSVFIGVGALLAFVPVSSADMASYVLDQSNTFSDGLNYGAVQISTNALTGKVTFTVTANNVQPLYGQLNKFGLDSFGFNYQNLTSTPQQWAVSLPANWVQDNNGGNQDGFGRFDVTESTSGANNRLAQLVFSITLPTPGEATVSNFTVPSTGNAGQGNYYFAAHVAGFNSYGESQGYIQPQCTTTSHWIAGSGQPPETQIPAPAAAALGAIGLALTGGLRRRSCA